MPLVAAAGGQGYFRAETGAGVESGTWPGPGAWSGNVPPRGAGGYGFGYGTGGTGGGYYGGNGYGYGYGQRSS